MKSLHKYVSLLRLVSIALFQDIKRDRIVIIGPGKAAYHLLGLTLERLSQVDKFGSLFKIVSSIYIGSERTPKVLLLFKVAFEHS